jgi:hypothetical protein
MPTLNLALAILALLTRISSFQCQPSSTPSSPGGPGTIISNVTTPSTNTSLSTNASLSNNTSLSNDTSTDFRDPCARLPLTPELWQSLNLDDYLRNFPGGKNLSLEVCRYSTVFHGPWLSTIFKTCIISCLLDE